MEYKFNMDISGKRYTIQVDTAAHYGYFENNKTGSGGGLWFDGRELTDYDGVFALPTEVIEQLRANGFLVDVDFE